MPKKPKPEKEVELDVAQTAKKETFVTRWFKDYAVDNAADLKIICELTSRAAEEQFFMYLRTGNTEVYGVIFYATFLSILDFIRGKQKSYSQFTMEICNSINIGYSNSDDEENEKVGNFMPIMEYIGVNRPIVDTVGADVSETRTNQSFLRWKELNIKKNVEYYKEIQENAYNRLKTDYHVNIHTSEAVIPLFCIFLDNITSVLKKKFEAAKDADVSEVKMNVLGLFDVYYSYDVDNGKEIIDFQPNIRMKLALKSDEHASKD